MSATVTPGEIITCGLGQYGSLTAVQWLNGTSRFDTEQGVLYDPTKRRGGVARAILLSESQPFRILRGGTDKSDGASANVKEQQARKNTEGCPGDAGEYDDDDDDDDDDGEDPLDFTSHWYTPHMTAGSSDIMGGHGNYDECDDEDDEDGVINAAAESIRTMIPWHRFCYVPTPPKEDFVSFVDPVMGMQQPVTAFGAAPSAMARFFDDARCPSVSAAALMNTADQLRRQLEATNRHQGLQFFADCEGAFGGLTAGLSVFARDELGGVPAIACHASFSPLGDQDSSSKTPAEILLRQEESLLNRVLAFTELSEVVDLFMPHVPAEWRPPVTTPDDFLLQNRRPPAAMNWAGFDPMDDVATAAVTAAVGDTALYPCRMTTEGEYLSLPSLAHLLRPSPAMRIVGTLAALPMATVPHLPSSEVSVYGGPPKDGVLLWDACNRSPLLARPSWVGLSGLGSTPLSSSAAKGPASLIVAQSAVLRGLGGLPDTPLTPEIASWRRSVLGGGGMGSGAPGSAPDAYYPRLEALLRYGFNASPTSASEIRAPSEPYPVSSTFPATRLFSSSSDGQNGDDGDDDGEAKKNSSSNSLSLNSMSSMPIGVHTVNSFAVAKPLGELCEKVRPLLRYKTHIFGPRYGGRERDEWRETAESIEALRDTYDHSGEAREDMHDAEGEAGTFDEEREIEYDWS